MTTIPLKRYSHRSSRVTGDWRRPKDHVHIICDEELRKWFTIPRKTNELDLVLSTRPHEGAYKCEIHHDLIYVQNERNGEWHRYYCYLTLREYVNKLCINKPNTIFYLSVRL